MPNPKSVEVGTLALPPRQEKNDECLRRGGTYRDEPIFTLPIRAPADMRQFRSLRHQPGLRRRWRVLLPQPQTLTVDLTKTVAQATGGAFAETWHPVANAPRRHGHAGHAIPQTVAPAAG